MKTGTAFVSTLVCTLALWMPSLSATAGNLIGTIEGPAEVFQINGDFDDVFDELVLTIENRGQVISYISHAQGMLERTAGSVGDPKQVYENARVILFCKAGLSHDMAAESPHNLVLCPYNIAVYTLVGGSHTNVSILYMSDPSPVQEELRVYLTDIIGETASGF